jgi:hypothetical protein
MACNLSAGRLLDCKTDIGGIQEVLFADWNILNGSITLDANEQITDFDAATLYRFELKGGSNSFNQEITANGDAGTVFVTQTLVIQWNNLTATYRKEMANLIRNRRLVIFVRDNNDNIAAVGLDAGAEVTAGTFANGANRGDFSGTMLTFTAECRKQANFVEPFTDVPFDNIPNATISPAY